MAQEAHRALTRALVALVLAVAVAAAGAAGAPKTKPAWAELTADQQGVLEPLKTDWDQLSTSRKKTWVGIASRYPSMKPEEQQRVQMRMQKWAKLTPEQRRAARERYRSIGKLPPEKRESLRQHWAEYQALHPGEKRMLDAPATADPADRRKRRAATATQTSPQKPSPATK